jgi:hypothetical protein
MSFVDEKPAENGSKKYYLIGAIFIVVVLAIAITIGLLSGEPSKEIPTETADPII